VKLRGGRVVAQGKWDARGTLGVDREAPVSLTDIALTFELDTDADAATVQRLVEMSERFCVIYQTLRAPEVTIKPRSQVDEAFSWDAGEGDRTRDWWLDAHRRYFARQASQEGFEMDDEILTVFERFEVVWPLDVADGINGPTSAST
jgi:hypothetical protein